MLYEPQDNLAYRFSVSVKGVVRRDAQVILLHNERHEWELPGDQLKLDELPAQCVVREIHPPAFPGRARPKALAPRRTPEALTAPILSGTSRPCYA